jgi:hypothetical protein
MHPPSNRYVDKTNHAHWDVVSLVELHPATIRWDKETPHMKEIVRTQETWHPLTNLLDPDAKPYLILDQNNEYHIIYWKAWFEPYAKWSGSDWYDSPPTERNAKRSAHWPKRIWELSGVEYKPRKIVDCLSPLEKLLADYKVKSHKSLPSGLIAIRKGGEWLYFRFDSTNKYYRKTGSTQKLRR